MFKNIDKCKFKRILKRALCSKEEIYRKNRSSFKVKKRAFSYAFIQNKVFLLYLQSNKDRLTCCLFKNIENCKCERFLKRHVFKLFFFFEARILRLKRPRSN